MDHKLGIYEAVANILPLSILESCIRYFAFTFAMWAILWIAHRGSWRRRIIQNRSPTKADYRREVLTSIRSMIIFAFITTPAVIMRMNGFAVERMPVLESFWGIVLSVSMLLVIHDTYFYWTHRVIHHQSLFRKWHKTHHRSVSPNPFTAYAFDWREAIVHGFFLGSWVVLAPTPFIALFIWSFIMIIRNIWGHAGTELHPAGMADHWLWGNFTTTVHHDLHHSGKFSYNFGLYFTWWDRLMGTEHPEYRAIFREITERTARKQDKRLVDQTLVAASAEKQSDLV